MCDFNVCDVTGSMEDSRASYLFICRVNFVSVLGTDEQHLIYPTISSAHSLLIHCSFPNLRIFFSYSIAIAIRLSEVSWHP